MELPSGLNVKLNAEDMSATVCESFSKKDRIDTFTIPKSITYQGKQYTIKSIGSHAFMRSHIDYLKFDEESEVTTFEEDCFYSFDVKKIQLPKKLTTIRGSWCRTTKNLTSIEVHPENKNFAFIDGKFLVGKSSPESDKFDAFYFVSRDVKGDITIPAQIEVVKEYSCDNCTELKSILFQENSKAKRIERLGFNDMRLQKLDIPENVEFVDIHNYDNTTLINVVVSDKNKTFKYIDDKYLLTKSEKSEKFDVLCFVRRDVGEFQVPSCVCKIGKFACMKCSGIKSITFEKRSSLNELEEYAFTESCMPDYVEFPATLTKVGYSSFNSVNGLKKVSFLADNIVLGGSVFEDCSVSEVAFTNARKITFGLTSDFKNCNAQILVRKDAKFEGEYYESIKDQVKFTLDVYNLDLGIHIKEPFIKEQKNDISTTDIQKNIYKVENNDLPKIEKPYDKKPILISTDKTVVESGIKVINTICEDSTSICYKVYDTNNSIFLFTKVFKPNDYSSIVENSTKAFDLIKSIQHPCICKAYNINIHEPIAQNKTEGVAYYYEFNDYDLKNSMNLLNNTLKVKIAIEVAFAMSYAHKLQIVHRNLNINNIMLNCIFEAKVINIGIHNDSSKINIDSLPFASPELLVGKSDYKTDVYSYGVVLYYLFIGNLPKQTLNDKKNGYLPQFPINCPSISQFGVELIKKCLAFSPKDRPSFDEIIEELKQNKFAIVDEINLDVITDRYKFLKSLQ